MRKKYVAAMIPTVDGISSTIVEVPYQAGDGEIMLAIMAAFNVEFEDSDDQEEFEDELEWFLLEDHAGYILYNTELPSCDSDLLSEEQELYKAVMYGLFAVSGPKDLIIEDDGEIYYVHRQTDNAPMNLIDAIEELDSLAESDTEGQCEMLGEQGYAQPEITYRFGIAHKQEEIWIVPITGQVIFDAKDVESEEDPEE